MKKKYLPLSKVYQLIEPGPVVMVASSLKGKANIMTMSRLTMVDFEPPLFEPPLIAAVISDRNFSFNIKFSFFTIADHSNNRISFN